MEDGVEFPLRLRGDVIVQILVAVGDVLPEIDLTRVDLSGEHLAPIISEHAAFLVHLQDGKEEHVLDVGGGHYPSALTQWSGRSNSDLLLYLSADNGLGLMGIGEVAGVGHIGMQAVAEKLLDDGDRAVVGLRDIPEVREALCVAVSRIPWAR